MMKPLVILVVAVLAVVATLPPGEGDDVNGSWPCCDDCGICNRMIPPKCQCNDISAHGCHPKCNKCVRDTLTASDDGAGPVVGYRCADMLTNFCHHSCTPAPAPKFQCC